MGDSVSGVTSEVITTAHLCDRTIWDDCLNSLQQRIKPHNFDMWLKPITCVDIDGASLRLKAPNRYIKEWFEDNYLGIVLDELRNRTNATYQVTFELDETEATFPTFPEGVVTHSTESVDDHDFEINERYRFDSFVVGPSNQLAHAAARAVSELPAAKYNPLFVYGGVGLGKTHLLCAIGHEIRRTRSAYRIVYLSSEQFMNEYINHLRSNRMDPFRSKYREHCDVLLIDDIQFIAGKKGTQDEFFHTFNSLYDMQRQIVVTSDKYPHEIPDLEERLRTRFQWGLIADIQQPELETRVAILKRKAELERIHLPQDVALYLASNIKSNVRELEGSLIRVAAIASLKESEITIDLAATTLRNLIAKAAPSLTIETIQKEVAAYFGIKVTDLRSPKRHKAVARPRQIAMYLSRKLTNCSFPEIGQRFGGKDHSTVISACNKIARLVEEDLSIRSATETLERQLQA
jgi:chromosomal replication initiator protein